MNEPDKNKNKALDNSDLKQVTGGGPWTLDPDATWPGSQESEPGSEWRGDQPKPYQPPCTDGPSYLHDN